jgi:DNA integrity scanning protein DisA with diadenylate cyclase activity
MNSIFQSFVYAAAPLVAAKLEAHFAKHLREALPPLDQSATLPDKQTIETIINTAFWTSLQREEGYSPKVSLAYLPSEQAGRTMMFEKPLPLEPRTLTRLSPGVKFSGGHLGVWSNRQNQLSIWGGTRTLPHNCFVLEILEPGLLVVKQNRESDAGKFANILILSADQIKEIDENKASFSDCPSILSAMFNFGAVNSVEDKISVPIQLAAAMREHGHGGSLLIVPQKSNKWRESIVPPIPYSVSPSFTRLSELTRQTADVTDQHLRRELFADTAHVIEAIAGLTVIDGATVINDEYELLAFGAKIKRRATVAQIEQVLITEPVIGNKPEMVRLIEYGGTRHLSAAQFVQDQPESVALVASQDGRFTIFAWSPFKNIVRGHRVETLLL